MLDPPRGVLQPRATTRWRAPARQGARKAVCKGVRKGGHNGDCRSVRQHVWMRHYMLLYHI